MIDYLIALMLCLASISFAGCASQAVYEDSTDEEVLEYLNSSCVGVTVELCD